jgi:alpha-galactosidase
VIRFPLWFALAAGLVPAGAEPAPLSPDALPAEFAEARAWTAKFLPADSTATPAGRPFSFTYDGRPSGELLPGWPVRYSQRDLDAQRQEAAVTYADPRTGLEVRAVAVSYRDFPTVEWTVYFKNTGATDTPILAGIQGLDARWERAGAEEFLLHHEFGTFYPNSPTDFMPQESRLEAGQSRRFVPYKGRACADVMPYFNLERSRHAGVIVVVGWPGAWAAGFARDGQADIRVTAGQELTHLRLHPGEEIRTPLIVLQFWRGDWIQAQNTWRRWMFAHNLPKPGGHPPGPVFAGSSSAQFGEMIGADEANQLLFIDRYREEKLPIDYWWMDAGWYVNNGRWQEPVVWQADPKRFPHGLRAITDHAHQAGIKSIVWFEPERVMPSNSLYTQHPEWLFPNRISKRLSKLLYLGNPAARTWLTDLVDRVLTDEGIDVYRQDFNVLEPAEIWRSNDAEDRQGITENHHLTGYLAYYDELLRRHPGLVIDSCAGGGSRIDLESMRRALPFWRSDYRFDVVSNQSQSYGLSLWVPFFGTATGPDQFTPYELRSNLTCPLVIGTWDLRDRTLPYGDLRKAIREWRDYAQNYSGDFYPLTPCSLGADVWVAWQFDRPGAGRGVVQAFRHAESVYETARVKLRGLDPAARYRLTDLDHPDRPQTFAGRELLESGLEIAIAAKPGSAVLVYEKLAPSPE